MFWIIGEREQHSHLNGEFSVHMGELSVAPYTHAVPRNSKFENMAANAHAHSLCARLGLVSACEPCFRRLVQDK